MSNTRRTNHSKRPVETFTPNPEVVAKVRELTDDLHRVEWKSADRGVVWNSRRQARAMRNRR